MSRENVKLFYEALARDKALQEKTADLSQKYKGQKLDEAQTKEIYQQELIPLARDAGYDFTLAELQEYASESKRPAMREVSEEELVGVAGGACGCFIGGGGTLGDKVCVCVVGGSGGNDYGPQCLCPLYGNGY